MIKTFPKALSIPFSVLDMLDWTDYPIHCVSDTELFIHCA